ncbi:hypothetical protein B0H14DRAFT_2620767 [Mycena olivaceomarginata]|nr:hypothetical protein B0H14DRAFT_2620767 [Mycena olivaceomarginata]
MPAVVVGGRDWVLWGMHKVKADACTLPAPCFSVEHGVRDGGHTEHSSHPSTSSGPLSMRRTASLAEVTLSSAAECGPKRSLRDWGRAEMKATHAGLMRWH